MRGGIALIERRQQRGGAQNVAQGIELDDQDFLAHGIVVTADVAFHAFGLVIPARPVARKMRAVWFQNHGAVFPNFGANDTRGLGATIDANRRSYIIAGLF